MKNIKTKQLFEAIDISKFNKYNYKKIPDPDNYWKYKNEYPILFDKFESKGYDLKLFKIGDRIIRSTILKDDIIFYHGSDRLFKVLKPQRVLRKGDKYPVLHLGDIDQAKTWGDYIYTVVIKKGTEIFEGPDGFNHIMLFTSIKPNSITFKGPLNYLDDDFEKIKNEIIKNVN